MALADTAPAQKFTDRRRPLWTLATLITLLPLVGAALQFLLSHFFASERVRRWRRAARDIVVAEVLRQFHADGGSIESASQYHQFSLEALLLVVANAARLVKEKSAGEGSKP